jgi:dTDP-4-dehydrorhamnose reductase
MKVVVVGAAGLLGRALCRAFAPDGVVVRVTHQDIDIRDPLRTKALINGMRADVVINAAAYTDVDGCESDPKRAFGVNAAGARNVAVASRGTAASHVYISTDYVFDGKQEAPYVESDQPAPLSIYGHSKVAGERLVLESNPRSFVVRTAWLYGEGSHDYVHAVLEAARAGRDLSVSSDQHGTPTWVDDLARQIRALAVSEAFGLYHASSEGSCTRYALAREILCWAGYAERPANRDAARFASQSDPAITFAVHPVHNEELRQRARRPKRAVLENSSLKARGLNVMPYWRDSLQAFVSRYTAFEGGGE